MNTTRHFRHTVIEAGRVDGPATRGGATPPRFSYHWIDVRLPLVVATGLYIGVVALFIVRGLGVL